MEKTVMARNMDASKISLHLTGGRAATLVLASQSP